MFVLLSLFLQKDLLHNFLLLNQKRANDSLANALGTSTSTISSAYRSLVLAKLLVLLGSKSGDSGNGTTTVSTRRTLGTLLDVMAYETTAGCLCDIDFVRLRTVRMSSDVCNSSVLYL